MTRHSPPGKPDLSHKKRSRWVGIAIFLSVLVVAAAVMLLPLYWQLQKSRDEARRALCASNMKNLAAAMIVYSNSHGGRYPDSLATLIRTTGASPQFLVCPDSRDTPLLNSVAATNDAALAGHNSYVYLGGGKTSDSLAADAPILYESTAAHGQGMNVMYGDFSVAWCDAEKTSALLRKLPAGH